MTEPEQPAPPTSEVTTRLDQESGAGPVHDLTGRVLGDFRVERRLGQGGMGEVYLAHQLSLDRKVALKVLRPDLLTNPTNLSRFEAEATAVAKLNHPNIVHVYTLGDIDGLRYIAMEYVQGMNLREYLNKKGPPDLLQAMPIMKQAAQAIATAGEVGLIHRDIKPENLLLNRKGQVKVADFGLCRVQGAETLHLTQPGITLGTPMYMSPEQVQGQPLDHRSDLYSLGVTFYHMLAGFPPFRAETPLALALKHVREVPVSLAVHRPDLPPDLVLLVMKLLAKEPSARYQTAKEMIRDLDRIKQAIKTPSAIPAPQAAAPSRGGASKMDSGRSVVIAATTVGLALGRQLKGLHRPRRSLIALSIAALVVGGLLGAWGRPRDLLAAGAPEPKGPSALWLDPSWRAVPRQSSARRQFRHAQLRAAEEDRVAAWLAVPGVFPDEREWAFKAYTQLARTLLRRNDRAGLEGLAADLEHADRLSHAHLTDLAKVVRAAVAALGDDPQEVVEQFKEFNKTLNVPALIELGLEVTLQALRMGNRAGSYLTPLNKLQRELAVALSLDGAELADPVAPD
jgi:tRNA A-37 threonylcarbamoyl transferase component Bud32